jgi:predicted AlkP superfamily phosphohydrolase/phosphomutase
VAKDVIIPRVVDLLVAVEVVAAVQDGMAALKVSMMVPTALPDKDIQGDLVCIITAPQLAHTTVVEVVEVQELWATVELTEINKVAVAKEWLLA